VQLVRVTHPFHPFADRQLVCVGERHNRSGKRLLLRASMTARSALFRRNGLTLRPWILKSS
jgi:hypothetical protein